MKLKMEELVPLIIEVISSGSSFKLYPNGQSMLPTIVAGEDSVELSALPSVLKKYDIVLYKRDNGQYVLHRIVRVGKDCFDMCGDNQIDIEKNVLKKDIIAYASAIYKREKCISTDSKAFIYDAVTLYRKKRIKRLINRIKRILHPVYKVFKHH